MICALMSIVHNRIETERYFLAFFITRVVKPHFLRLDIEILLLYFTNKIIGMNQNINQLATCNSFSIECAGSAISPRVYTHVRACAYARQHGRNYFFFPFKKKKEEVTY